MPSTNLLGINHLLETAVAKAREVRTILGNLQGGKHPRYDRCLEEVFRLRRTVQNGNTGSRRLRSCDCKYESFVGYRRARS